VNVRREFFFNRVIIVLAGQPDYDLNPIITNPNPIFCVVFVLGSRVVSKIANPTPGAGLS
jgi:hypothetical protein